MDVPGSSCPPLLVDTTCDAVFTHDFMTLGMLPPSSPGTFIANEDNIQLGFDMFFDGFGMTYGSASVIPALPTVGFDQVLTTSNILAVYDLSAFPNVNEVSLCPSMERASRTFRSMVMHCSQENWRPCRLQWLPASQCLSQPLHIPAIRWVRLC